MNIITRKRIQEPNSNFIQMHRNTRIDNHTLNLFKNIDYTKLHRYPVIDGFKEKYASFLGVNVNNILLTSGVDGAIRHMFETLKEGDKILLLEPTYAMYRVYINLYNINVNTILPDSDTFTLNIDNLLEKTNDCKAVFIANPNAPIETVLDVETINKIANLSDKIGFKLFIDEAYYGFGSPTSIDLINKHENLYIARSFSKWFGLPSIRLGGIISNETRINELESSRLAYETNTFSMLIAETALENLKYFQKYSEEINNSRLLIENKMHELNIKTHGKLSNNILINHMLNLESKNILLRKTIPYPAENWMSLTLGSMKMADVFIQNFEILYNQKD